MIKVFFRRAFKSDLYLLIKLIGLSTGVAACLLIFLYVSDEIRYDRHHEDAHNSYRLLLQNPRTGSYLAVHPGVMQRYLEGRVPGVSHTARVFHFRECTVNPGDNPVTETGFVAADPSLFDILSFKTIAGDPVEALNDPHSLVLTEPTARRFFGEADPLGEIITFENMYSFVVRAIIEAPPEQSHLQFSILAPSKSLESINPSALDNWSNQAASIYFRLTPGADAAATADQIRALIWEANPSFRDRVSFALQPLLDIRLRSGDIEWDTANTGSITVVRIFSITAILILALACFNFVNLSVALVMKRAKEVGIKKVLGASRKKLILQYMAETALLAAFSITLALLLSEIFLPWLNTLSGKNLSLWQQGNIIYLLLFLSSILLLTVLLAGGYPSLVISRFQAVDAMKGTHAVTTISGLRSGRYRFRLRQMLVVIQFAVSIALIISSTMVYKQMQFLSQRYPGYNRQNLVTINNPWDEDAPRRAIWLRERLLQHPEVTHVSLAHNTPPVSLNNYTHFRFSAGEEDLNMHGGIISCDINYFRTLQSKFIHGRDFEEDMRTDAHQSAIINAAAAERLGKSNPVGIWMEGFYDGQQRQVIGVVENIHFSSMHERVEPMAFIVSADQYPQNWRNLLVRYKPGAENQLVNMLEELWQEEIANWPLEYHFVEDRFMAQYQDDRRMMHILAAFSVLAILLSVLGLLGLSLHASVARTKEIGIRKVLGASRSGITRMITSEFGILVVLSNLLAWPAAYLFISRWLGNFAYSVDMSWLMFAFSAMAVYVMAILVTGFVSLRAAGMNPVVALQANE